MKTKFVLSVVGIAMLAMLSGLGVGALTFSNEAKAVIVGAICGVTASIPVSIALIIASSSQQHAESYRNATSYAEQDQLTGQWIIYRRVILPQQPSQLRGGDSE